MSSADVRGGVRDEDERARDVPGTLPFGAALARAMDSHGPLCVGIDPHRALLEAWGLPDTPQGLREFALRTVEALGGRVAAVKPQSAFFERHGAAGIAVLEETLAALRATGTLCVLDVKRGDIGSTMSGYAQAYLTDGSPLAADAITVSPYLGLGSLAPALELAESNGRGVFVLALTSNPEGSDVQHAVMRTTAGEWSVARGIVEGVGALNESAQRAGVLGSVGLVIGATVGGAVAELGIDLRSAGGPLLAPGVGAQGAGPRSSLRSSATPGATCSPPPRAACCRRDHTPRPCGRLRGSRPNRPSWRCGADRRRERLGHHTGMAASPVPSSRLTVLAGPTAVGKGTVVAELRRRHPDLFVSVSVTTRPPRPGEVDGVHYYFVSDAEFDELVAEGQMLEWALVHGAHRYGTPREPVQARLNDGRPALLEIDLAGARQVRRSMPSAQLVFLMPPNWEALVARLTGRGTENSREQERRLATARMEMDAAGEFDHLIVNDTVARATDELESLLGLKG